MTSGASLHYGIFVLSTIPPGSTPNEIVNKAIDQIRHADKLGFERAWTAEHNGRIYGITSSAQMLLAAAAASTKNIRLGTAVSRLPLHHPLRLAEDFAYIDQLSGGRLDFGIGKGYDPVEFQAYDVNLDERDERYQETLDIVMQAWQTGKVSYQGKHLQVPGPGEVIDEIPIYPEVFQKPTPPVYVMVSSSEESLRKAARQGHAFVLGAASRDQARDLVNVYREEARTAGYSFDEIDELVSRCQQFKAIHVADTTEQAQREFKDGYMWFTDVKSNRPKVGLNIDTMSFEQYVERKMLIVGSPDDVAEELSSLHSHTGLGGMMLWFDGGGAQPQEQVLQSMTTFTEKVRPQL
ncbi:LLM class flavin-dependent oxidoreductase [Nocardioides sp. WS12]|uniref:LLM class flavin-dependent oxidoreductase n=1 Tax=Nocardioides sp. WS12 TaxID=2486272 RepID=UPI0015FD1C01|nr:LLM class flavin-dependent oxidoreductase [Nocardioides sp. WS12]